MDNFPLTTPYILPSKINFKELPKLGYHLMRFSAYGMEMILKPEGIIEGVIYGMLYQEGFHPDTVDLSKSSNMIITIENEEA